MTLSKPMLVAAFFLAGTVLAQEAKVTPLLSKDLTEVGMLYEPVSGLDQGGLRTFRENAAR